MNLLLVEDEVRVAEFVQSGLNAEGWTVTVAHDGETAIELLAVHQFEVVILDLMLPGINGYEVCRRMRAKKNATPVLILSALDDVEDRVAGLRLGADDFLSKPFDFEELLARLEALTRRATERTGTSPADGRVLRAGEIQFDTWSLEVTCQGRPIDLSAKERDILKLFLNNPERVFSRERILNALWKINEDPLTNVVDVYVGRLRKKLGDCGGYIKTVRGAGYRLSVCARDSVAKS